KVYGGLRPPANLPLRFSAENSVDGRRRAAAQKALAGNGGQSTIGLASLLMGRMAWQRKAAQWPLGRLFLTLSNLLYFFKASAALRAPSFTSPAALCAEPLALSILPSASMLLSPVNLPAPSLMAPFALSAAPFTCSRSMAVILSL